jgi:6-phosphofructokinase 1
LNGDDGRVGILMGGGPAPGINSAISAATIEAVNQGHEVVGILDGFSHLMEGRTDMTLPLAIADVAQIHHRGGSIIRTSRANPTRTPEHLENTVSALGQLGISYLVTIGGDDTAFSASEVSRHAGQRIRVAHIPKTIDNDLPLPGGMPTFGYETARHLGTEIVRNLIEDFRTTNRWYFVTAMGRAAGHLALGIGKAAAATLSIIPEEFPGDRISVSQVCDVLETAILKRRVMGKNRGLAVVAEGVAEKFDPEELAGIPGVEVSRDQHGHLRLGDIQLEKTLRREVQRRFEARGESLQIVDLNVGYELRSYPPIPFDIDYTRSLGYGAASFLLKGLDSASDATGGLICLVEGRIEVLPFSQLRDPSTGRTKVRTVDINGDAYRIARKYMIRLEKSDLANYDMCCKLAKVAGLSPDGFVQRYRGVVELAGAA